MKVYSGEKHTSFTLFTGPKKLLEWEEAIEVGKDQVVARGYRILRLEGYTREEAKQKIEKELSCYPMK